MPFKHIPIFCSGGHIAQWSRTVCAILVEHYAHIREIILNLGQWLRCCSMIFLFKFKDISV